ncbi:spore coat protein [Neobacillus cucumis]|uniref:spore coat protein n=1 Tax=Neobacillus cucumis TaxID=1740721 RepID=UPI00203A658E|nr:spore coat protein [Neobacillus cucumis]MCM3728043.1 spore coat protein [Neobacillus cucumis]
MSENWKALDHCCDKGKDEAVTQEADQLVSSKQQSFEWIVVKDSEQVCVHTTDTQIAVSLQAAIQAAIAVVISITIGDTEKAKAVVQDLKQLFKTKQRNSQKTIIKGSKCVEVTTTDTQVAVNIQALLQVLVAIVAKLDIL